MADFDAATLWRAVSNASFVSFIITKTSWITKLFSIVRNKRHTGVVCSTFVAHFCNNIPRNKPLKKESLRIRTYVGVLCRLFYWKILKYFESLNSFTLTMCRQCCWSCRRHFPGNVRFLLCGPKLWNGLLQSLRDIVCIGTFRRHLKTYLFLDF